MSSETPKTTTEIGRGDASTIRAADDVLSGKSKKGAIRRLLPFLGPAFIASVAYIDPGNFATNIQVGRGNSRRDSDAARHLPALSSDARAHCDSLAASAQEVSSF